MVRRQLKSLRKKRKTMQTEIKTIDIFERLRSGETIQPNDPEAYKMIEASFATKKLLVRMNSICQRHGHRAGNRVEDGR